MAAVQLQNTGVRSTLRGLGLILCCLNFFCAYCITPAASGTTRLNPSVVSYAGVIRRRLSELGSRSPPPPPPDISSPYIPLTVSIRVKTMPESNGCVMRTLEAICLRIHHHPVLIFDLMRIPHIYARFFSIAISFKLTCDPRLAIFDRVHHFSPTCAESHFCIGTN